MHSVSQATLHLDNSVEVPRVLCIYIQKQYIVRRARVKDQSYWKRSSPTIVSKSSTSPI